MYLSPFLTACFLIINPSSNKSVSGTPLIKSNLSKAFGELLFSEAREKPFEVYFLKAIEGKEEKIY